MALSLSLLRTSSLSIYLSIFIARTAEQTKLLLCRVLRRALAFSIRLCEVFELDINVVRTGE